MGVADWELWLRAIAGIIGSIVTLYQLRKIKPQRRSTLKTDLEILRMLETTDPNYTSDPNYQRIKAHVDLAIDNIYSSTKQMDQEKFKVYSWSLLILGIIFSIVFLPWTVMLYMDGSWWAVVTGFFTMMGIGYILMSFDKNIARLSNNSHK